jgi:hypothetical protein
MLWAVLVAVRVGEGGAVSGPDWGCPGFCVNGFSFNGLGLWSPQIAHPLQAPRNSRAAPRGSPAMHIAETTAIPPGRARLTSAALCN